MHYTTHMVMNTLLDCANVYVPTNSRNEGSFKSVIRIAEQYTGFTHSTVSY